MDILTAEEIGIVNRIADLMEKGSGGMQQGTGMYFIEDSVCAIGACLKAVGVGKRRANQSGFSVLHALGLTSWPRIEVPAGQEPFAYSGTSAPLIDVIIHLNDKLGWRFDQIVSWLRDVAHQASVTPESA